MKVLVRFSRGRLKYTGQLARSTFAAWADSPGGRLMLDRQASRERWALFGRARAAQRRVWRRVVQIARAESARASIQRELDAFLPLLQTLAYAPDLPRVSVELRRLVVVPRLLLNGEMYRRLDRDLEAHFGSVFDIDSSGLRDWFLLAVIRSAESAVAGSGLSPWRPLQAGDDWIAVGVDERFAWRGRFARDGWPGHYYLLELRRVSITRAVRTAARDGILHLEEALPSLSGLRRNEILRTASETLQTHAHVRQMPDSRSGHLRQAFVAR
jgi:hypothetical protein